MREHHDVIVIGGGLSGLYAAWRLQQQQVDVVVLEARPRTGGRILSEKPDGYNSAVDLGPAWIWPAFQRRMQALVDELDIPLFRQNVKGDLLYETENREVHRHAGPSSHHQSFRIAGGNAVIIEKLRSELGESSIRTSTRVTAIRQDELEVETQCSGERVIYNADRIILAIPPRLLLDTISLMPVPDEEIQQVWRDTPTWMASHCKIVYLYRQPFWREQGLSGEVFSRRGPLSEIYDGSPADESFYALTSFAGLNARQRQQLTEPVFHEACMDQLQHLFGPQSLEVFQVMTADWSKEPFTATAHDLDGMAHHPQYPANMARHLWDQRLLLAGTEIAREQGGYLEGALETADESIAFILS